MQQLLAVFAAHPDRVRVDEARMATVERDAEVVEVAQHPLPLLGGDLLFVMHEIGHRRLAPERKVDAMEVARFEPRERERSFAQRLARKRPRVGHGAADERRLLHHRHALAEDGGCHRALFSRGAAADDDEVVLVGSHARIHFAENDQKGLEAGGRACVRIRGPAAWPDPGV